MRNLTIAVWALTGLLIFNGPLSAETGRDDTTATEASEVETPSVLDAATWFQKGVAHWQAGQREAAIASWREAVRLDPALTEAQYNLNIALRDQEILERRDNCLLADDPIACLSSVNHLSKSAPQTPLEELRALDDSIRFNPKGPKAVHLKGTLEDPHRYQDTLASLTKQREQNPEDAETHYRLCGAYRARGEAQSAAFACEEAVRLRPDYLEAHHLLGGLYLELLQTGKAANAYSEVVRLNPQSPSAWFNLGLAQGQAGETEKEIDAYQRALELGAAPGPAHLNLSAAYDQLKDGARAIDHARQAKEGFVQAQNWREAKRSQDNVDLFMKKYWGLPRREPLF